MIPGIPPGVKLFVFLAIVAVIGALQALYQVEPGWTWVATIVQILGGIEMFFTTPKATQLKIRALQRAAGHIASAVGVLLVCGACLFGASGCGKGAASPVWTTIENTILQDVENGTALADIEAAVLALDPALGGVAAAADQIIQIVITYLEQVGAIPVVNQAAALALQTQIAAKLGPMGPNCVPKKAVVDEVLKWRLALLP